MLEISKEVLEIYEENKTKDLILFRAEKYNNQTFKIVEQKIKIDLNQNGIYFVVPDEFSFKSNYYTDDEMIFTCSKWGWKKINQILSLGSYAYYTFLTYRDIPFTFVADPGDDKTMYLDTCSDRELLNSVLESICSIFRRFLRR